MTEYVEAYRERMERMAYMLYNTAGAVGHFIFGHSIRPWEAFPGIIKPTMEVMSDEAILAAMEAWCC